MDLNVYIENDCIVIETGIAELSTFKLFDTLGTAVIIKEVFDHEKIPLNGLEDGNYQYKLIAGANLQIGKIKLNR